MGGRGRLARCVTRTVLLELLDHTFEIGIAGAKDSCEPVAAALGDRFAVGDYLELSGLAGLKDGFHAEALFDQGHETRDLGLVVVSRGAVDDFDLHWVSNVVCVECSLPGIGCGKSRKLDLSGSSRWLTIS